MIIRLEETRVVKKWGFVLNFPLLFLTSRWFQFARRFGFGRFGSSSSAPFWPAMFIWSRLARLESQRGGISSFLLLLLLLLEFVLTLFSCRLVVSSKHLCFLRRFVFSFVFTLLTCRFHLKILLIIISRSALPT